MRRLTDITDLPVELLEHIFAFLPDQSLTGTSHGIGWLVAAHVCRLWREIALSASGRVVELQLRPDRAHRDIQALSHELFSPLPVALVVEEYRLDLTRVPVLSSHWTHTLHILNLLMNRVQALHVKLRQHTGRLQNERIEELLALVLVQPTLKALDIGSDVDVAWRAERELKLMPLPVELQGGGLRILKVQKCRLHEQSAFLPTLRTLEELSTTVHGPLQSFLFGLHATYLTSLHLTWLPPSDPARNNDSEEPKEMPALLELSLQSPVEDALTFMHAIHSPALVSLKFEFVPKLRSGTDTSTRRATGPLVDWLSSRFGDVPSCTQVNISATAPMLRVNMSWRSSVARLTHRTLNISFPRLPTQDLPFSTARVEDCAAFLSCLSDKFSAVGNTTRVSVIADPPTFVRRGPTPYPTLLKETVLEYLDKLHRTSSLHLGSYAAIMILTLPVGSLPLLSELQIGSSDPGSTAHKLDEDQVASLRSVAHNEADLRRGKCRVVLDGDDLAMHASRTDSGPADGAENSGVDLVDRAVTVLHL
ncbi:unnamed protein product [Peniophora sp. CBMAI 1063]|nr:unnamed protein product [Peniophora sp. CBMAI 1063]